MLLACAQTCELCQMFAGAPFFFFSAELHLLLGQTTIVSTLSEVRLKPILTQDQFGHTIHLKLWLSLAHQVSPSSQAEERPQPA